MSIRKVCKQFSGVQVLSKVDLEARGGKVLGLVGVNGAGKTTLMNIIAGEVPLDEGEIHIGDKVVRISSPSDSERLGIALIHGNPWISRI